MSPFRIRYMVSSFIIFGFNSSALSNNIGCDRPRNDKGTVLAFCYGTKYVTQWFKLELHYCKVSTKCAKCKLLYDTNY